MKHGLSKTASVALLLLSACADTKQHSHPTTAKPVIQTTDTLIGSYEFNGGLAPSDVCISVTVSRNGDDHVLDFLATHPDAHGAAPDGSGVGHIGSDGVLRFAYEDSFSNRGSGTFRRSPLGYALSIHIDHVHDSRCMMFYGDFTLQRANPTASNIHAEAVQLAPVK